MSKKESKPSARSLFGSISSRTKEIPHTINGALERNNNSVFASIIRLIGIFMIDLIFIAVCCKAVNDYTTCQSESFACLLDIQDWVIEIEDYIDTGIGKASDFDTNYGAARFQECVDVIGSRTYGSVQELIDQNNSLLGRISEYLQQSISLVETDKEAADAIYNAQTWPSVEELEANLAKMGRAYDGMVKKNNKIITVAIIFAVVSALTVTLLVLRKAKRESKRTSDSITGPINTVAELAESMSTGSTDTAAIDKIDFEELTLDEAKRMLTSFRNMADSIAQNVDVVRRVADGDMTAFVNIRSDEDALGKNLYKMVQNNDMMFANVAEIAEGVAEQIGYIASANTSLAEGCTR